MRRRDKAYIMDACRGKLKADLTELFVCDGITQPFVADRIILAENAAQIAAGKKYGTGTARAGNTGFFTEMRSRTCDDRCFRHFTKSVRTFGFAAARAGGAGIHQLTFL
jgi:hypothetical protein